MKVLITGGSGKLGRELIAIYPGSLHPTHKELDVGNKESVFSYIKTHKPDMVIHTAALTGINPCENNKELAFRSNYQGTENLVKACELYSSNCRFIYISTACVFRGDKGDYTENDIPYPKNFYSFTKFLGEFAVKYSSLKKWLIVRTNFVGREKWLYPKAFSDRWGTYLFADDLAKAIRSTVESGIDGLVHVCGDKKISMLELARITTPSVQGMTLEEYSGPPLTQDMSLKTERIKPFKITF